MTHARFLVYLETWPYFRDPGTSKLSTAEFAALDHELQGLETRVDLLGPETAARHRELRCLLMLD